MLRLLSPFLFKVLLSSLIRKANQSTPQKTSKKPKNKTVSDSLGEYVDYEEKFYHVEGTYLKKTVLEKLTEKP